MGSAISPGQVWLGEGRDSANRLENKSHGRVGRMKEENDYERVENENRLEGGKESARRLENKLPGRVERMNEESDDQRVESVADEAGGQESTRWLENKSPEPEK